MELKEILERIAIKYTDNRKNAILEILKENDIYYDVQEIQKEYPKYTSRFSYFDFDYDEEDNEEEYEPSISYYYNILVDLGPFEQSKEKILLTAHYDVVNGSTGANDNGSSLAILLKLITDLGYTNLPIRVAFLDGEEIGGVGSRGYIDKCINTPELKDNITVINFDVCGCGDDIVIEDRILNKNKLTDILLSDDMTKKYNVYKAPRLPFNDAKIFAQNDIDALCIVVLPKEDIDLMYEERTFTKDMIGKKHFGSYVWEYQHNGRYDSIEFVNYKMMQKVYEYILEIFK